MTGFSDLPAPASTGPAHRSYSVSCRVRVTVDWWDNPAVTVSGKSFFPDLILIDYDPTTGAPETATLYGPVATKAGNRHRSQRANRMILGGWRNETTVEDLPEWLQRIVDEHRPQVLAPVDLWADPENR